MFKIAIFYYKIYFIISNNGLELQKYLKYNNIYFIVLAAVKNNGNSLYYASNNLKDD